MSLPTQKQPSTLARILPAVLMTYLVVWTIAVTYLVGSLIITLNTEFKYGYIDHTGKFAIKPYYDSAEEFKDGKAEVGILHSKSGLVYYYLINNEGARLARLGEGSTRSWPWNPYNERGPKDLSDFRLSIGKRSKSGEIIPDTDIFEKWGQVDTKMGYRPNYLDERGFFKEGWSIPPIFDKAIPFNRGEAWVYIKTHEEKEDYWGNGKWGKGKQGYWGMINKKGEYLIKPMCTSAGNFKEGLAPCMVKVYFDTFYITPYGVSLAHRLKPPLAIRFLLDIATH